MRYHSPADKLRAYAHAIRGLLELEPDPERRLKYVDFIDIYAALDENELAAYQRQYPQEAKTMESFASRFEERGIQKGLQQGKRQGEAEILVYLLERKFGPLPQCHREIIDQADADTLLRWAERVLTAGSVEEVFQ